MLIPRKNRKEDHKQNEERKSTNILQGTKKAKKFLKIFSSILGSKHQRSKDNEEKQAEQKAQEQSTLKDLTFNITGQNVSSEEKEKQPGVVIDASITGVKDFDAILDKILKSPYKIILTSITIRELAKLQKVCDVQARNARYVLALAAKEPENFSNIRIHEVAGQEDDCIVKYCSDNKEHVILLTADKEMVLNARSYGVHAEYLEHSNGVKSATSKSRCTTTTLPCAQKNGNNLVVINFHTKKTEILVKSRGMKYNSGIAVLKLGDEVFVATKQTEGVRYDWYKVISLYDKKNCVLILSRLILNYSEVSQLYGSFKDFVQETLRRFPLH